MQYFRLLFFFLLAANFLEAQEVISPIIDELHGISIPFPETPLQTEDTLFVGADSVFTRTWSLDTRDTSNANFMYWVESALYPPAYIHSDSSLALIESLFNDAATAFSNDTNFVFQRGELCFLSGYPGKIFKFSYTPNGNLVETRMYLIGGQFLQFEIYTEAGSWHNPKIESFYEAISLVNRPENKIDYGLTYIENNSYTINFPEGEVIRKSHFLDSEFGRLNLVSRGVEKGSNRRNIIFMVVETKYPEYFNLIEADQDSFLNHAVASAARAVEGDLLSSSRKSFEGYPGIEVLISIGGGQVFMTYRFFLVNQSFYCIGLVSRHRGLDGEAITFFNSFQLLKNDD